MRRFKPSQRQCHAPVCCHWGPATYIQPFRLRSRRRTCQTPLSSHAHLWAHPPCRHSIQAAAQSMPEGSSHTSQLDMHPSQQKSLAIITGGSRGLGASIAAQLASCEDPSLGWNTRQLDMVLLAQDKAQLEARTANLMGTSGNTSNLCVVGHALDLGNMAELQQALPRLTSASKAGGWLPSLPSSYTSVLLVNNAGTTGKLQWSWEYDLLEVRREMDLNVVSPAAITSAVVSTFIRSPRCKEVLVVNISSVSATQPYECFGVYAAGKAARLMLSKTLAREADLVHNPAVQSATQHGREDSGHQGSSDDSGHQGSSDDSGHQGSSDDSGHQGSNDVGVGPVIRSISYAPGALDTDMQAAAREALPREAPLKAAFESNALNGRLVDPTLSAQCLIQLLSGPRSAWENGAHLSVYDLLAAQAAAAADNRAAVCSKGSTGSGKQAVYHPLDYSKH